jgi:hypothetical protein
MEVFVTKDLKTGDILHCNSNRLLSKMIRWVTKSNFANHTAVVVECWGQLYVVDAQKDGVNPRPIDQWYKDFSYKVIVARPKIGPKDPKAFSIKAFTKVGNTAYDFASLIVKYPLWAITGKWKKESDPQEKMFCSEYVAWLWQIENSNRIDPHALMQHTSASTNFKHYQLLWTV